MVMVGSVMKKLPIDAKVVKDVVREISKDKGVDVNLRALDGGASA